MAPLRILFIGNDSTLAHVSRPLVLAQALPRDRYQVFFACGEKYRSFVEATGLASYSLPNMPTEEFTWRLSFGRPLFTEAWLKRYIRAELELFAKISPNVVVGDFRVSLGISAESRKIPYISLINAHWSPFSTLRFPVPEHPFVSFFGLPLSRLLFPAVLPIALDLQIQAFNRLRRANGLKPIGGIRQMYSLGTWTLYPDIPALSPTKNLPHHHQYLGPILWEPKVPPPSGWEKIQERTPLIYVSMGSSGDSSLYRILFQALKELSATALVATAGQRIPAPAPNVFVCDYLPAMKIIPKVNLVISNGGSPTNYQAFSHGVPVLGLPTNIDQYFTMEGVARAGAGRMIRSGLATVRNVQEGIEQLLTESSHREAARKLQAEMAQYNPSQRFAAFLNSLSTKTA